MRTKRLQKNAPPARRARTSSCARRPDRTARRRCDGACRRSGVGAAVPLGAYDVLDYLIGSNATVGDGLDQLCRYFDLVHPAVPLELERGPTPALVVHPPPAPPHIIDYLLAVVVTRFRDHGNAAFVPARAEVLHAAPASGAGAHERILGCPVRFSSGRIALALDPALLALPLAGRDAPLGRILERHARELLARRPEEDDWLARVEHVVAQELCRGNPTLDHVASRLGASARTVQRRLAEQRVVFKELVGGLAERHLRGTSWTGQSPSTWRLSET